MSEVKEMKRDVQLNPGRVVLADHARNVWSVTAAYGTTREDIENPSYWMHHASRLRAKDKIEVHSEDGTFYAEYLVLSNDKTWAKVHNTVFIDLRTAVFTEEQTKIITEGYETKFRGPRKWSVIRKSDNAVLHEGLHSEEDARKWLSVHLNAQGIAA